MFELTEGTRYRFEPDIKDGTLMLYNIQNEQFRVTDRDAYQIVTGIQRGDSIEQIAAETNLPTTEITTFCESCVELGFLSRENPAVETSTQ
jgi:predicted methyltransferase